MGCYSGRISGRLAGMAAQPNLEALLARERHVPPLEPTESILEGDRTVGTNCCPKPGLDHLANPVLAGNLCRADRDAGRKERAKRRVRVRVDELAREFSALGR